MKIPLISGSKKVSRSAVNSVLKTVYGENFEDAVYQAKEQMATSVAVAQENEDKAGSRLDTANEVYATAVGTTKEFQKNLDDISSL